MGKWRYGGVLCPWEVQSGRKARAQEVRALKCSPLLPTLLYILKQILRAIDDHNLHTLWLSIAQFRDLGDPTTLVPHIAHLPCPVPR